jgi:hypothetical protein
MPERVNDIAAAAVKHIDVVIRNSARTRPAEEVNRLKAAVGCVSGSLPLYRLRLFLMSHRARC